MTRPGRPTGPTGDTTAVVLTAALELLLSEGAAALTPQRLHTVTGVSRSTVYRHWPSPRSVLEALVAVAPLTPREPAGDLGTDLHAEVDRLCDRLRDRPVGGMLQALVAAVALDPSVADLRRRYITDLLAPFHAALGDAAVPEDEAEDVVTSVISPLLVDALLLGRAPGRTRAHRTIDEFLEGRARR
ncbi:TetR/AcrR family transcriptional regulator [Actinocorallia herbida]|uniref:TetR/AcrR family transcriptional regulator n=1 Tax=Actinocorallia herbida TaxID=58109 RepID=UPI000F4C4ABF|nr:TetR/AcrR family transcriptional regulator [Actinocorallia herbida]